MFYYPNRPQKDKNSYLMSYLFLDLHSKTETSASICCCNEDQKALGILNTLPLHHLSGFSLRAIQKLEYLVSGFEGQ